MLETELNPDIVSYNNFDDYVRSFFYKNGDLLETSVAQNIRMQYNDIVVSYVSYQYYDKNDRASGASISILIENGGKYINILPDSNKEIEILSRHMDDRILNISLKVLQKRLVSM